MFDLETELRRGVGGRRFIAGLVLVTAVGFGCAPRPSETPPRTPTAAETPADGGLPIPAPSTRKSVIVPSDMGLGEGASGPSSNSGTSPPTSPPLGGPPSVGY